MVYILEGDHFVSEKQRRIAEILSDFYPYLQLQFIPPAERSSEDNKNNNFRVVDITPGQAPYVICFAEEADERLLATIIKADNSRRDIVSYLDAHNAAAELLVAKKDHDKRMEDHELVHGIWNSTKIGYRHNGFNWGRMGG